jgi:hypothetical protein
MTTNESINFRTKSGKVVQNYFAQSQVSGRRRSPQADYGRNFEAKFAKIGFPERRRRRRRWGGRRKKRGN